MSTASGMPTLRKAQRLIGHQLVLRNADARDAAFIVRLRTDAQKKRFISPTSPEVAQQTAWLTRYAHQSDDAYFVAEDFNGHPVGTIRLYDAVDDSFCFGGTRTTLPARITIKSVPVCSASCLARAAARFIAASDPLKSAFASVGT